MQVLNNDNSTSNLHEKAKDAIGGSSGILPEQHDFFAPLNEFDPLTKKPIKEMPLPKFEFRVFYLAGSGHSVDEETQYKEVMNKIVSGAYYRLEEQTYHTKDGDIRVFLRWLELPEEYQKSMKQTPNPLDLPIDGVTDREKKDKESQKPQVDASTPGIDTPADATTDNKADQKLQDMDACPAPDPAIVM